jgi:hypothetical protein
MTNKATTNPAPAAFTRGAPRYVDLFVDTKTALSRANIHTNLSGALTQVPVGKVITVDTLTCLSLLSTVNPILYRTCSGPIPLIRASRVTRNNFLKLIVLFLFNVK